MLYPLIGPRLHGWLDDLVSLLYIAGAFALGLHGAALIIALGGAALHFALTRFTDYPQGTVKLIPFRVHAFIELGEGIAVLGATWLLLDSAPPLTRAFLTLMSGSQFVAFGFSDYGPARPKLLTS
ncbi:MAG TPA: hypothetical protein VH374_24335 [Polyangia bacterium]|jgi:hypothetical protein|nr:hypothetical protein [Polyangia bacterium]